jgi:phosphoserine phosphatase RsbU/P
MLSAEGRTPTHKKRMPDRRTSLTPEAATGLGAAVAALVIVFAILVTGASDPAYVGWLAIGPFLAAAFVPWLYVVGVGLLASLMALLAGAIAGSVLDEASVLRVIGMAAATAGACGVAVIRQRQNRRFAELSRLATVAAEAVLRPIGPQVGRLAIAGRYVSASEIPDIGGDLYEALDTPYGVRVIIGDVRGKGIDAIRLSSIVLGSYRHVAYERPDLRSIVDDLDKAVARSTDDEDFVTAALVEERGGTLTVVNCGHPSPLLLRRGSVIPLDPPQRTRPLGLRPAVQARVEHLEPGDRLLLYTDGLAEARQGGAFFPTADRAWRLLGHGTVENGLLSLESALSDWVNRHFDDDIALVLLEYTGAAPALEPAVPSWEIGGANIARR